MGESTWEEVMDLAVNCELGEVPIREYLKRLLTDLWRKEESFNGKRPFGNSGWQLDVYAALARGGVISGTFDENGYLDDVDEKAGEEMILKLIDWFFEC